MKKLASIIDKNNRIYENQREKIWDLEKQLTESRQTTEEMQIELLSV